MTIKFILDSIHLGKQIIIREFKSNLSDEDIKSMFTVIFGIQYNSITCSYEIVNKGDEKND